jgi:hypothetical protein
MRPGQLPRPTKLVMVESAEDEVLVGQPVSVLAPCFQPWWRRGSWAGLVHKGLKEGSGGTASLRPLREQVIGDLESWGLRQRHCQGQTHGQDGRRDSAAERGAANKRLQSR